MLCNCTDKTGVIITRNNQMLHTGSVVIFTANSRTYLLTKITIIITTTTINVIISININDKELFRNLYLLNSKWILCNLFYCLQLISWNSNLNITVVAYTCGNIWTVVGWHFIFIDEFSCDFHMIRSFDYFCCVCLETNASNTVWININLLHTDIRTAMQSTVYVLP